jgi:hypothetical protein
MAYSVTIINGRHLAESPHFVRRNPTDKKNPSPDILPPDARALWDSTHRVANSYYNGAWDLADMAAWRAVKMRYPNGIGRWNPGTPHPTSPPGPLMIPDPEEMIVLGRALEYVVLENPPRLDVYRFKNEESAPKLMWSPSAKMLMILPETQISNDRDPDLTGHADLARRYREWSWGQDPRGRVSEDIEPLRLEPLGMIDSIVYRSGKGTDVRDDPPGVQEYIHQSGDGVVIYQGPSRAKPKAIVIRGGNLDVQQPGIIN